MDAATELVEATLSYGDRPAVLARAWLMKQYDTAALCGSGLSPIPPPQSMPVWNASQMWLRDRGVIRPGGDRFDAQHHS